MYVVLQCRLIVTSGQSNLISGRITATHEWFSGICQVAPLCTPNLIMLPWPTRVQILNGILIGSDTNQESLITFLHPLTNSQLKRHRSIYAKAIQKSTVIYNV